MSDPNTVLTICSVLTICAVIAAGAAMVLAFSGRFDPPPATSRAPELVDEPARSVTVTTIHGAMWSGVLTHRLYDDVGRTCELVLEAALLHTPGAPPTPAPGPVRILSEHVHFWQIVPPSPPAQSPPADA